MPDGKYHSPFFTPYVLYGKIDYIYGWKAYNSRNGFTGAQATLNVVETLGYVAYLYIVWKKGNGHGRALDGGWGGLAALIGFASSIMTLSKTALYGQYFALSRSLSYYHCSFPFMASVQTPNAFM